MDENGRGDVCGRLPTSEVAAAKMIDSRGVISCIEPLSLDAFGQTNPARKTVPVWFGVLENHKQTMIRESQLFGNNALKANA